MGPPTLETDCSSCLLKRQLDPLLTENNNMEPWDSPRAEKTGNPQFLTGTLGKVGYFMINLRRMGHPFACTACNNPSEAGMDAC